MPRTLKEYITAKSGDDSSYVVDEMEYHWLETLSLDTWNSEHFSILPVMVVFVGKSGPDPEWTRLCVSDRMLCTTTHDGWMDDKSKLAWLNVCIEDDTNPYGERPQLSNFDGHWSNETIEYSVRMEEAKVTGLETPGHHTAALQQMDQRGGPIQHANRVAVPCCAATPVLGQWGTQRSCGSLKCRSLPRTHLLFVLSRRRKSAGTKMNMESCRTIQLGLSTNR